jgi:SAM-dependent methyltransferase
VERVDFGLAADVYATHRAGFPESLFERLAVLGVGLGGQRVVDLGTGTGSLTRGFASRGCQLVGLDLSRELILQAQRLDRSARIQNDYLIARAESIGLQACSVDVVAAGQCWHWFGRRQAAGEAYRIMRPGCAIVIAHFDWIPTPGNLVEATEDLILAYNPQWNMARGMGLYLAWLGDLSEVDFEALESFSYDVEVNYTPIAWRGRIRASAGIGASLPQDKVIAFDGELKDMLATRYPGKLLRVPHRVFAVVGRKPGGRGDIPGC